MAKQKIKNELSDWAKSPEEIIKTYRYAKPAKALKLSKADQRTFMVNIVNPKKPGRKLKQTMRGILGTIEKNSSSPFIYHKPVEGKQFLNYAKELKSVSNSILGGCGLNFISAYSGHGKTSFAYALMKEIKKRDRKRVVTYVSLKNCKTEFELVKTYVDSVAKSMGTSINWGETNWDFSNCFNIADLPNKLAQKSNIEVLVILDDFDAITGMENQISLEGLLRSIWQIPNNVAICVLMTTTWDTMSLVGNYSRPFYHTGMYTSLGVKFDEEVWQTYIQETFAKGKRSIDPDTISFMLKKMNYAPKQIQYLCHWIYISGETKITSWTVEATVQKIVDDLAWLYETKLGSLTKLQQRVLFGYVDKIEVNIPQQFRPKTIEVMCDFIERYFETVRFLDPFLEAYIRKRNNADRED